MSINEKFVQAVSSINYNKGVFSLYFIGQEPHKMAQGVTPETDEELALKQVIHIPASGFIYMVSMIKSMLEDPRIDAEFEKLIATGLLPIIQNESNVTDENTEAPHSIETKSPISTKK